MTGPVDLADRLDYQADRLDGLVGDVEALARDVADLNISVEALAAAGGPPDGAAGVEAHYASAADWVAAEFAVLAAPLLAAGGRWCLHWDQHPVVHRRIAVLWETWEVMHGPASTAAMREEWLRLIFDHHAPLILAQSGPLAACSAAHQRHTPPPPLPLPAARDSDPGGVGPHV